jgi:hypothetical protein
MIKIYNKIFRNNYNQINKFKKLVKLIIMKNKSKSINITIFYYKIINSKRKMNSLNNKKCTKILENKFI